jgi:23S rRNA pseudouridine1911/1915/1917 synthase
MLIYMRAVKKSVKPVKKLVLEHEPTILYEDANYLVINKPAGLMVHDDGKTKDPTLCDWLVDKYPAIEDVGEPLVTSEGKIIKRPGIVHRLDRATSGALAVAKTQKAFLALKAQFGDRTVEKIYNAFVYGKLDKEMGSINLPIGRSKGDFRQYTAPLQLRGEMRDALTYYRVVAQSSKHAFLELVPKTGRTHQIRVHVKAIRHPVVCDRVYAKDRPCDLGFDRLALHARKLSFMGLKGKKIEVEAPFPPDFEQALQALKAEA